MSSIKLDKEDIYNHSIAPIPESGKVLLGIGLDGNLKKKDSFGIVTNVDSGEIGATGTSGIDGGNTTRWQFGSVANVGEFSYGESSWGVPDSIHTLVVNSISINSINSYNWLNVIKSMVTVPDTYILKIEEVGNATNFAFFTIQSIIDNVSNFSLSVRLTSTGSGISPIVGKLYGISAIPSGSGGGSGAAQDNFVRTVYINTGDLPFSLEDSFEQQICNYILALPEAERTILETDSKWNVVIV